MATTKPQPPLIPSALSASTPPPPAFLTPADPPASRRASLLLLPALAAAAVVFLAPPPPAFAFSLGIPGPKEWLKDKKRKASRYILAPVDASRRSLRAALDALSTSESVEIGGDLRKLLNSASRDCVVEDRSSVVAFQARTGVEVCTYSLLVKNAASLLDDRDPVKLETEARLGELVRSFSSLGSLVDNCNLQHPSDRQKVEAGFRETISALDNFEQGIKNCLGI